MRVPSLACSIVFAGALAGCALGPEYFTPDAALPVTFLTTAGWQGTVVRRREP